MKALPPEAMTVVEDTLIEHRAFAKAVKRLRQAFKYAHISPEPIGLAILGESRSGKSRVVEELEKDHPRTRTEEGAVVPIVRMVTPSNPAVGGMASLMLKELGDPDWAKGTVAQLQGRLVDMVKDCMVRMIVLEEFQHLVDSATQKVFYNVANWLKTLVEPTKVALVVCGLESSLPVLLQDEQFTGRLGAPLFMPRFDWEKDDQREEFVAILEGYNDAMAAYFKLPKLHGEDMSFRLWCASGGLVGLLAKLLRQIVWNACDAERSVIKLSDFAIADAECTWRVYTKVVASLPFEPDFVPQATKELLEFGRGVGVRIEIPDEVAESRLSARRRRARAKKGESLAQVLSAS
jgi:hypothetical protein